MKRFWLFLVLAVVLTVYPGICGASEAIVGEWLAMDRTKEGLGVAKSYGKDGSLQVTSGSLIDYRYNLTGNKLVLSAPPQEAAVFYVEINGSKLILTDLSGKQQKLTRVAGDGKSGILGKWSGDHHTGRPQIMHFTSARNCYVSVPIVNGMGRYSIKGDIMTETIKGKGAEKWEWAVYNDVLTMKSLKQDKVEKYRKKE